MPVTGSPLQINIFAPLELVALETADFHNYDEILASQTADRRTPIDNSATQLINAFAPVDEYALLLFNKYLSFESGLSVKKDVSVLSEMLTAQGIDKKALFEIITTITPMISFLFSPLEWKQLSAIAIAPALEWELDILTPPWRTIDIREDRKINIREIRTMNLEEENRNIEAISD